MSLETTGDSIETRVLYRNSRETVDLFYPVWKKWHGLFDSELSKPWNGKYDYQNGVYKINGRLDWNRQFSIPINDGVILEVVVGNNESGIKIYFEDESGNRFFETSANDSNKAFISHVVKDRSNNPIGFVQPVIEGKGEIHSILLASSRTPRTAPKPLPDFIQQVPQVVQLTSIEEVAAKREALEKERSDAEKATQKKKVTKKKVVKKKATKNKAGKKDQGITSKPKKPRGRKPKVDKITSGPFAE